MKDTNTDVHTNDNLKYIDESLYRYIKIIALYFILPLWVVGLTHIGIVGWKVAVWFEQDVHFLQNTQYISFTILVLAIPLLYLLWFYYLTIKKALERLYEDILKHLGLAETRLMSNTA